MKNITESQQAIIDSLINEFSVINERENNQSGLLIDVGGILAEKRRFIKYNEETEIINANIEKIKQEILKRDAEKLNPDLVLLGLKCTISGDTLMICKKDSSNYLTFISYNKISLSDMIIANQRTDVRYSGKIKLCLHLQYTGIEKDSIEEICKHPNFVGILEKNCTL